MARHTEQFKTERGKPQNREQSRAWNHITRVLRKQPTSVRTVSDIGAQPDACIVKFEWSVNQSLEFICAGGVLVGIPPFGGKKSGV